MAYVLENLHWFVLLIGGLVFFHELGHFVVAKACGIKVIRFSLGFGPRLFSFQRGETEYRIGALPLGGYVKMLGEMSDADVPPEEAARSFSAQPLWQRTAVVAAGPAFNFLLAFLVYFTLFAGTQTVGDTKLGIVGVGEPAWEAGLRPGDRITAVNGVEIARWGLQAEPPIGNNLVREIGMRPGEPIRITFERDGASDTVTIVPQPRPQLNEFQKTVSRGKIGVSLSYVEPLIGVVDRESPAARAGLKTGDRVTEILGRKIVAWQEVRSLIRSAPDPANIPITVERAGKKIKATVAVEPYPEGLDRDLFSAADHASGYTGIVSKESLVANVVNGTPADDAGLRPEDRLLHLRIERPDGSATERAIGVWGIDLNTEADARSRFVVTVQRGREIIERPFALEVREELDELKNKRTRYVFGAENDPETLGAYLKDIYVDPAEALAAAGIQVAMDTTLIGRGLGMLFRGSLPLDSMGGPIMLFVIAEKSAKRGWENFLRMMAIISVNLGLLNLLPVPVLDGGHLMFFGMEAIRRRPPSVRTREIANVVGLALLLMLMVLVFRNDILRYVLG